MILSANKLKAKAFLAQSDYERALELLMQSSELLSADEADQVML